MDNAVRQFLDLPEEERDQLIKTYLVQRDIRRLYQRLKSEKEEISNQIIELQTQCKHSFATKVAKSDTGNWCKADDRYWYEFDCPDCGKRWTEDQ